MSSLDSIGFAITVYAVALSLFEAVMSTRKVRHYWRTRHLQRVWGIRNGDDVIVVCSELDDPASRQMVEAREFIYSLKYGDVDAFFDVVVTLLRLYPAVKLRVMSAGEVEQTKFNVGRHLVVIGGPDYNALAERVLSWNQSQFEYRSAESTMCSEMHPDEIVLYDKVRNVEYCHTSDDRDFGYFERLPNRHNPQRSIILIGGCHTIGVSGAVKAFSMAESDDGDIPSQVLRNAEVVSKSVKKAKHFSVLVEVERIGQTVGTPLVEHERVSVLDGPMNTA